MAGTADSRKGARGARGRRLGRGLQSLISSAVPIEFDAEEAGDEQGTPAGSAAVTTATPDADPVATDPDSLAASAAKAFADDDVEADPPRGTGAPSASPAASRSIAPPTDRTGSLDVEAKPGPTDPAVPSPMTESRWPSSTVSRPFPPAASTTSPPVETPTSAPTSAPTAAGTPASSPASSPTSPPLPPPATPASDATPAPTAHADDAATPDADRIRHLPVASIVPNQRQPRTHFDPEAIASLARSIEAAGLMQPIVVRPHGGVGSGLAPRYELVAGERRLRAMQHLGRPTVPAVVRAVDDRTSAEWALVENLQREDLNPIDRAEAFRALVEDFGLSHGEVAEAVGLDRSSVSNFMRLCDLDETVKGALRDGRLGMGHGRALLGISDEPTRVDLAIRCQSQGWSVRELERVIRQAKADEARKSTAATEAADGATATAADADVTNGLADPVRLHMDDLEQRLGEHLGTRVRIRTSRTKGQGELVVSFYDLDQFEGLLDRLGFEPA